jgi:8-amino-7-oxononanoate synthase
MDEILKEQIAEWQARGVYRSMRTMASPQGRKVIVNGIPLVNFCSNDYLGLAADPRLVEAMAQGAEGRGTGAGASRLVCGNFDEHAALESEIAAFKQSEAALVFPSGYMANTGIIPALVGREDVVFSDKLNHASIVDGILLSRAECCRYPHKDMAVLADMLARPSRGRKLIVTDTVFSMDGDVAPLGEIAALARKHDAWLMVDEAHAFGVLGQTGAGLAEACGVAGMVDVQMGTLSKAAGVSGAYAAGSVVLKEFLVNSARAFIYTTAMPPSIAAACRASLRIMGQEPQRRARLLLLAGRLRRGLRDMAWDVPEGISPIMPLVLGDEMRALKWSEALLQKGLLVSAIRPPTVPKGTARLRLTVTAAHTDEDVALCLEAFRDLKRAGC